MAGFYVVLDPFSYRRNVIIYNSNTDVFYTTPRANMKDTFKKDMATLCSIFFLCIVVIPLLDAFFYSYLIRFWNAYVYGVFVFLTAVSTALYCKNDLSKLNRTLQYSEYQNSPLTIAENLTTLEQRQKYFYKIKSIRNMPKLIAGLILVLAIWVFATVLLMRSYSTAMLFGALGVVGIIINISRQAINTYTTDADLKYLIQKFASKS